MESRPRDEDVASVGDDPEDEPRESPPRADDHEPSIIVVVGASAGGVSALQNLIRRLPGDFAGAVFVVLHSAPDAPARLPLILARTTELTVTHAKDGERILGGRVYVAPPDRHLLLRPGYIHLSSGPRENGARPAIDPMFRSAANEYGARAVGIILSGTLDDGTAGLLAIESAGGVTIVQDPEEALFPDMPRNAARFVEVSHTLPLEGISKLLTELSVSAPPVPPTELTGTLQMDAALYGGEASGISCPECDGSLWSVPLGDLMEYRCQIGHRYTPESLFFHLRQRSDQVVQSGLRSLEQQALLASELGDRAHTAGVLGRSAIYRRRAASMRKRIAALRELLGHEEE